ncbi:MAG: energy-coupling factor transporter transmembrane component T family protein [Galactobacter sp.]
MRATVIAPADFPVEAAPQLRPRAWLARRDPLIIAACALVLAVPIVVSLDPVTAAVVLAAAVIALPFSSVPPKRLALFVTVFILGGLMAVWGTALIATDSGAELFGFGPYTVTTGSLYLGLLVGLRALAVAVPAVVLLGSVDATRLADGLAVRLRLPVRFVLGALGALRLGGVLTEEWRILASARRARGLSGAGFVSVGFALLVQAIRRGTRLATTMDAKGFAGSGRGWHRSWARPVVTGPADVALLIGCVLVALLAAATSVAMGAWNPVW